MSEEIDRWIEFMRTHPDTWKKHHTAFINAQFEKANSFMKRLAEQPSCKRKFEEIYGIKNWKGYPNLCK